MYAGQIVEIMPCSALNAQDRIHPYTRALWQSAPSLTPGRQPLPLPGEVPSPLAPPPGCRFHPRGQEAASVCQRQAPPWQETEPGHLRACHRQ
jgi:oligopeptide/dipeptide ABC transporter ATP-binding protein